MIKTNSDCVRYYLLKKQSLFLRSSQKDILKVIREIGGIYSSSPTCHFTLAARITDYTPDILNGLIGKKKKAGRISAMRKTIFILPVDFISVAYRATERINQNVYEPLLTRLGIDQSEYNKTKRRISAALKNKTLTATEIRETIKPWKEPAKGALSYILASLCTDGFLTRTINKGDWRNNQIKYALFRQWFPKLSLKSIKPITAKVSLARFYFQAYSPSTWDDFKWWSGLTSSEIKEIKPKLEGELDKIFIEDLNQEKLIFSSEEKALCQVKKSTRKVINFLPVWDNYLMGYKNRRHFVDPNWQQYAYDSEGNSTNIILIDGQVEGIWDYVFDGQQNEIKIALFQPKNESFLTEKKSIFRTFKIFLEVDRLKVSVCPLPAALTESSKGNFLSPLKNITGKEFFI